MSFSWLGLLIGSLVLSLGHLAKAYRESFLWRRTQIELDNTAIQMGQRDRATMRKLKLVNKKLSRLDRYHHLWHSCAQVPATAVSCRPKDLMVEAQMRALVWTAEKQMQKEWSETAALSKYALTREKFRMKRVPCPQCRLPLSLEPVKEKWYIQIYSKGTPKPLKSGYLVNYQKNLPVENTEYELAEGKGQ